MFGGVLKDEAKGRQIYKPNIILKTYARLSGEWVNNLIMKI